MLVHAIELLKARWGARQSSNKQPATPSRESKLQQLKSFASRTSPLNPFGRRSQPYRRAAKQESSPPSRPSPVPDRSRLSFTDFDVATSGDYWPDLKWSEHPITGSLPRSHTTNDITQLASRVAESDWRESPPPGRKPMRHHHRGGSLTSFPYANEFASESQSHLPPPSAPSPPPIPPASTSTPPTEIMPPWLLNHSPPAPRRRAKSPMPLRSYTQPNLLSTISETQKANHFSIPHRTVFREEFSASPSPVRRLRHYQMYPPPAPAAPRSVMATTAVPTHQRRRLSTRRRPAPKPAPPKSAPPKPTPLAELFPEDDLADEDNIINAYTNSGPVDREPPAAASITATPTARRRRSAPWPTTKGIRRDSAAAALDPDDADDEDAAAWPDAAHKFAAHWQAPMSSPMPASRHDATPYADGEHLAHQHQRQHRQPHHKQQQHGTTRHSSRPPSLSPPLHSLPLPHAAVAAAAAFHLPSRARLSCESVRPPYASGGGVGGGDGVYADRSAAYAATAMPIGVAI